MASPHAAPRILLHLPNWLGDTIMCAPLIEMLNRAFASEDPGHRPRLFLAVRDAWSELFAADPRVAGLLIMDRAGRHRGWRGIARLSSEFRAEGFAAILIGPPSLRAGLTAALAGIPLRVGFRGDGRDLLLRPALARGERGEQHFSREMLRLGFRLLEEMGSSRPPSEPAGLPSIALRGCAASAPANLGEDPVWVVAPGTTYGQAKTWPAGRVAELIHLAVAEHGVRIVLLGDAQSRDFVATLRAGSDLPWCDSLGARGQVVDLTGRTGLGEVVGILKAAQAFVGNDSGLMHLAGALGVATVGIFGSSNPGWTHPLGAAATAIAATGFACQPCYRRTCNQNVFCLETVSAEAVLARLREMLAAVSAESGRP